jgi:hypothetical protein
MVYYKKDSVMIREFIEKNRSLISTPKIIFSQKSRTIINKIQDLIKTAFKESSVQFFKLLSPGAFGVDFEKSPDYSYICADVRHVFEKQNKYKKTIEMRITNRTYKIRFVLPVPLTPSDERVYSNAIDIYARRMYIWLYVANHFMQNNTIATDTDIFLYLTDEKKIIPELCCDPIDRINVNSGFTGRPDQKMEINIFRNEEWFKVFIHETFHSMGFDFSNFQSENDIVGKEILKKFHINANVLLYETYSELWAEIINVIITIYIETHGKQMSFISLVEDMLETEMFFSLFQCAKIFDHFKINYEDLFTSDNEKASRYKEKTSVFCYYVLKTILLFNCNMFVEWVLDNNNNSIAFTKPDKNIRKFANELIFTKYNDPELIECFSKMEYAFFRKKNKKKDFVFKTLRMTANEIV